MSNIFDGNEKTYEDMLDEMMETYTDEDCCECCGNAKATDCGLCTNCLMWIITLKAAVKYVFKSMNIPTYVEEYLKAHINNLEDF